MKTKNCEAKQRFSEAQIKLQQDHKKVAKCKAEGFNEDKDTQHVNEWLEINK